VGTHDLRVRLAQIAAQEGRTAEAAHLYAQVLTSNPACVDAWWGLSAVVETPERALYCVLRALELNPNSAAIHDRLVQVHSRPAAG
jgi:hypothetical protein